MYKLIQDRRDAVKRWRKKNRRKRLVQQARYREKYKDVLAERLRKWKKDHPDRVKLYRKRQGGK